MPTDISESKKLERGNLFYGRYRHSVVAYLFEANTLRSIRHGRVKTHKDLDSNIDFRISVLERKINYGGSWGGNRSRTDGTFSEQDIIALHHTLDWLQDSGDDKLVIYDNWIQIYTNDYQRLTKHEFWQHLSRVKLTTAEITHDADVIKQTNPQYRIRHYFRDRRLESDDLSRLVKFVENYQDEIKISPSFRQRLLVKKYRWLCSSQFFDTNNPNIQLLFEMSFPGLLRKTYRIEPR